MCCIFKKLCDVIHQYFKLKIGYTVRCNFHGRNTRLSNQADLAAIGFLFKNRFIRRVNLALQSTRVSTFLLTCRLHVKK